MLTSLYRRRAGVKHSTCTKEDVDTSIMNASTSFCGVHCDDHSSTGRDVRRAKMDISHHVGDARALFGAELELSGEDPRLRQFIRASARKTRV